MVVLALFACHADCPDEELVCSNATSTAGEWAKIVPNGVNVAGLRVDGTFGWPYRADGNATAELHDGTFVDLDTYEAQVCGVQQVGEQPSLGVATCWGQGLVAGEKPLESTLVSKVAVGASWVAAIDANEHLAWAGTAPDGAPTDGEFVALSKDDVGLCALTTDGAVACTSGGTPSLDGGPFVELSGGPAGGCALSAAGAMQCWGSAGGQPPGTFVEVSVAPATACALATDGTPACWGDDAYGCGGAPTGSYADVAVTGSVWCGLGLDQYVDCWSIESYERPPCK